MGRFLGRPAGAASPLVCAALLALMAAGCSAPTYNVSLAYDPSMALPNGVYPTVEADIAVLDVHTAGRLDGYPTDTYFQPGDRLRASLDKQTAFFSDQRAAPYTLRKDDPRWAEWNKLGAVRLYVIANLPGVWEAKFGKLDGRRLNLPLDSDSWPDGSDINILIKPGGLFLNSRLKTPADAAP